jgi:Flp pilus assembly protein TadG
VIRRRTDRRPRGSRSAGQSLVEFAIVFPVIAFLIMALFDFGRVVYAQNAIQQNASNAARFGSVSAPQSDAAIRAHARSVPALVAYNDAAITGDGGTFYPAGNRVVVRIQITVPLMTPVVADLLGGSITLTARADELLR